MDNPVFVFGSFSEDEASHFQYAAESSPRKDSQVEGSSFQELQNKRTTPYGLNASSSLVETTTNGDLKNEDSETRFGSLDSAKDTFADSCNGGANFSPTKGYAEKFVSNNKEVFTIEPLCGVNGNEEASHLGHELKQRQLPAELNATTQDVGMRCDDGGVPSPVKETGRSWAALQDIKTMPGSQVEGTNGNDLRDKSQMQAVQLSGDLWLKSLKEAEMAGKRLQPRGLVNNGNLCFLNATLQALISCSSFVHLLDTLQVYGIPEGGHPTLRAFVEFFREFEYEQNHDSSPRGLLTAGKAFLPSMFDNILHQFNPHQPATGSARSRQEDAQEFLTFTMDRLHDELINLDGKKENVTVAQDGTAIQAEADDDDWETVGPKNRTAVVRTYAFLKSALSDIFGGELCSIVKSKGSKASATVQPFLVLHLDILPEAVNTVEDALRFFAAPETLEGYRATAGKAGVVSASKSVKLQALPRVLILHLKRFSYGAQGSSKLHKPLHFPLNLTLGRDLLSNVSSGSELRTYELVATVTHHGKDPSRGHYTAHSKQSNGQWLRYDDGVVQGVGVNRVLQDLVYLLFYKRSVNMR